MSDALTYAIERRTEAELFLQVDANPGWLGHETLAT
jgi:hypothetical protein